MIYLIIFLVSALTIGSQIILKKGISNFTVTFSFDGVIPYFLQVFSSPYVIGALALQVLSYILWMFVIARLKLSIAFALSGSTFYILMALSSWVIFDERLSITQWIGLIFVSMGVLLLVGLD